MKPLRGKDKASERVREREIERRDDAFERER